MDVLEASPVRGGDDDLSGLHGDVHDAGRDEHRDRGHDRKPDDLA